jgi:hypothetical protein
MDVLSLQHLSVSAMVFHCLEGGVLHHYGLIVVHENANRAGPGQQDQVKWTTCRY